MTTEQKVPLRVPLQAYGDEVREITLRKPRGEDVTACGFPLRFNGEGDSIINESAVAKLIERLGAIPASVVKGLDPLDYRDCMMAVVGFFNEATSPSTSSTDTLTSPGSGKAIPEGSSP